MLAQYARQEEVWEPISDWGREFQAYLNRKKEKPLPVKQFTPRTPEEIEEARQRKLKVRREWARKKYQRRTPNKYCKCGRGLHANNKHGYCKDCVTKAVYKGKKPFEFKHCACGKRLGNRNKVGKCEGCIAASMRPVIHCSKPGCNKRLHRGNKSGLCVNHSGIARQQSYMARRKAAAA